MTVKQKLYILVCFFIIAATIPEAQAQPCGERYKKMIFTDVAKTSDVVYSTSNGVTLKMDIYEPSGDTSSARPLLILAHGGSFVGGDKGDDVACVTLCTNFAKRGYVTADIQYRLANVFDMFDSVKAVTAVIKAIGDGKSAIRFFRKDAATTNTYRIDPDKIFCGGNSAGAVLYCHSAYIDSVNEAPGFFRNIFTENGGIEGNSGNHGYSSDVTALVNLAGGLYSAEFIGPGDVPSFNAQGDQDNVVPYICAKPMGGFLPVRLCGLGEMEPRYNLFNIVHYSIVYPGEGHCPWSNNPAEMLQIDTTLANFLLQFTCGSVTGMLSKPVTDNPVSIYPNPAHGILYISLQDENAYPYIQLMDVTGREVYKSNINSTMFSIDTHQFSSGFYFAKIIKANGEVSVKKVMIE